MSVRDRRSRVLPVLHFVFVVIALASATPLLSCPQEMIHYPTVTVSQFKGRLLPPDGEEPISGSDVRFVVHRKGDDSQRWDVPVNVDGTFMVGLPEGTYQFKVNVEGFLFTLVGDVIVSSEAKDDAVITLRATWC